MERSRSTTSMFIAHIELHSALKNKDNTKVRDLLQQGEVRICLKCLSYAQENSSDYLCALLDYNNSDINKPLENGDTLLMRDICEFNGRNAELLINKGADVNYTNPKKNNISIIFRAIEHHTTPLTVFNKIITTMEHRISQHQEIDFQIPECIFISALFGRIDLLKIVLPWWNQHPLLVLLCLRPWYLEDIPRQEMTTTVRRLTPFLGLVGGPLLHGTRAFSLFETYISDYMAADPIEAEPINSYLLNLKRNPASLKMICRTIIRSNAIGFGTQLTNYLKSLVPFGLKNFLSLTENYDEDIKEI